MVVDKLVAVVEVAAGAGVVVAAAVIDVAYIGTEGVVVVVYRIAEVMVIAIVRYVLLGSLKGFRSALELAKAPALSSAHERKLGDVAEQSTGLAVS